MADYGFSRNIFIQVYNLIYLLSYSKISGPIYLLSYSKMNPQGKGLGLKLKNSM